MTKIQADAIAQKHTLPVWEGDTVYYESFFPMQEAESQDITVPLLFPVSQAIGVESATHERIYQEGTDYRIENGQLIIPSGSAIPHLTWAEYNPLTPNREDPFTCTKGGYLLTYPKDGGFHLHQTVITYRHTQPWDGPRPGVSACLPRSRGLLAQHKPLTIGFLGDSICTGCDASGSYGIQLPPNLAPWPLLITQRLSELYDCPVVHCNHAVGGTTSGWGAEKATELFRNDHVDLMVVAFGMNDGSGGTPVEYYKAHIQSIVEQTCRQNPDCEFVLVSTTLPNPLAAQFTNEHHVLYAPVIDELAKGLGTAAAVAPLTAIHQYLLTRKNFWDMTGNNINHPNDFLSGIYAQAILSLLTELR